jgi:hypothetical protein
LGWYIVTESTKDNESFVHISFSDLTREEGLGIIERLFETGQLSGKQYKRLSTYTWQYVNRHTDLLHLVNEKGLEKWPQLKQQTTTKR